MANVKKILISIFFLLLSIISISSASEDKKKILILYSLQPNMPAYEVLDQNFHNIQLNKNTQVEYYTEYLELSRFKDVNSIKSQADLINHRYTKNKPDIVIAVMSPALDFIQNYCKATFDDIPIVYALIDKKVDLKNIGIKSTGVNLHIDLLKTLQAALLIQPETRDVYVVVGTSPVGRSWEAQAKEKFQQLSNRINFHYLSDLSMAEVLHKVSKLPPEAIVLYLLILKDASGKSFVPRDALSTISKSSSVPVYGLWSTYVGYGIIGGHLCSSDMLGKNVNKMVIRILNGENLDKVEPISLGPSIYMFDWRQMERFGISDKRIPDERILLFKPQTAWDKYKWQILIGTILIILEAVLIVLLYLNTRKQKNTSKRLKSELKINEVRADISHELMAHQYDIKKVSDITLEYSKHITKSDHGFVSSIDKNTLENVGHTLTEMFGQPCRMKDQRIAFPIGDDEEYGALWGYALNTKKAFFTNSPGHHPSSKGIPEGHIPLKNYMAVPVLIDDALMGLIALANSDRDYSEQDITSIEQISNLFALAIHRQEYESKKTQLEERLRQSQKMESVGQLAGGIAHDFNNILYPIIGFTQLSQSELAKDHPIQENLTDILDGAKRARDLVKRILLFSRQKEHHLEPTVLQPIIKESYKLLRSSIPVNIDLILDLYDGKDPVLCDATEIHELILNLCTNAYHAIINNEGKITISLKRQNPVSSMNLSSGDYLRLSVKDNGVGIPDHIKDKIFEPYVTTKDIGKGSGLGLSVVYGIVKSYKGNISVKNNPDQGTEMVIFLPISKTGPDDLNSHDKETFKSIGNERILFVDDEPSIIKLGTRALERCGYHVTAVNDSKEAFRLFKSNPDNFDLVITDMAMPGLVGSELSNKILELRPDIQIIICSGYSEKLDREKAKDLKVSAFLDKPLSVDDLVKNTRKVLDKSKR